MVQFSLQAWKNIDRIYQNILQMPFIQELKAGSLNKQIFQQYIIQDGIYLGEFARVLAIISAKAPQPDVQLQFANSVSEAIIVERSLHENFFAEFGIEVLDALATEPSPTCLNYTNFLIATFSLSIEVILKLVAELELMNRVFYRASQFEWMFWNSAYNLEKWKI